SLGLLGFRTCRQSGRPIPSPPTAGRTQPLRTSSESRTSALSPDASRFVLRAELQVISLSPNSPPPATLLQRRADPPSCALLALRTFLTENGCKCVRNSVSDQLICEEE